MENTYIIIVGKNREAIAKAVAEYYGTKLVKEDDNFCVVVNTDLEADMCINEDLANEAIQELNAAYPGLGATIENFEF